MSVVFLISICVILLYLVFKYSSKKKVGIEKYSSEKKPDSNIVNKEYNEVLALILDQYHRFIDDGHKVEWIEGKYKGDDAGFTICLKNNNDESNLLYANVYLINKSKYDYKSDKNTTYGILVSLNFYFDINELEFYKNFSENANAKYEADGDHLKKQSVGLIDNNIGCYQCIATISDYKMLIEYTGEEIKELIDTIISSFYEEGPHK